MSNGIKVREDSVCFADGEYHYHARKDFVEDSQGFETSYLTIMNYSDFQLNTIKKSDYIGASELDTEQKYNDAVEVFGLFGFKRSGDYQRYKNNVDNLGDFLVCGNDMEVWVARNKGERKLTYNQLMAMGELKRLELERDKKEARECFVEALDETVDHAEKLENVWTDKHYDFNYQLTQEDIDKGYVRIDAYFVNRMWKVNSWDDTGAGFHIVKTIPRIANSKNPIERELIALHKQINALCKLHGVDTSKI